ncbi:unnamed protein product [Ambrosiozyma monospora]|uniref:peptidyl-tRNA hydrolase n=1 Tax=Ambrosiozyma monospora TaxID=43982 RepID=A0A9W6YVG0_AMBMO|nr:unnamed protein product [Ambrosiozyma monospora]
MTTPITSPTTSTTSTSSKGSPSSRGYLSDDESSKVIGTATQSKPSDEVVKKNENNHKPEDVDDEDEDDDDDDDDDNDDEDVPEVNSTPLNDIPGECRMALVVRQDLQMQKGKIAAQCAHAAIALYRLMSDTTSPAYNQVMLNRWLRGGQAKITLKVPDKTEMDMLFAMALSLDVNCYIVHDAGRTQVASGSATVIGLGPAPKSVLDEITGSLKLY